VTVAELEKEAEEAALERTEDAELPVSPFPFRMGFPSGCSAEGAKGGGAAREEEVTVHDCMPASW